MKSGVFQRLLNLGEICRRQGRFDEAEVHHGYGQSIASTHGLPELEGMVHLNRAAVSLKTGEFRAVAGSIKRAAEIFAEANIDVYEPELLRYKAVDLAPCHAEVDTAIQLAQRAVERAHQIDQMQLGQAQRTWGIALRQAGMPAEAGGAALEQSLAILQAQDSQYEAALTELEIVRLGLANPQIFDIADMAATLARIIETFRVLAADFDLQIALDLQTTSTAVDFFCATGNHRANSRPEFVEDMPPERPRCALGCRRGRAEWLSPPYYLLFQRNRS
ncbi:MAG: hypothetical protein R2911_21690 [Caldilineaceae bacterium]